MPAPFAALEARINAATIAHLANVTATIGALTGVEGIFDAAYAESLGMSGVTPVLMCNDLDIVGAARGDAVTINSTSYTVSRIEADGVGMSRLILDAA